MTGVPKARREHAVVMAKFARDIMSEMCVRAKKLESTLGEGTGDLTLRIGIHSGAITAGVLRGDRARFQVSSVAPEMVDKGLDYSLRE